LCGDQYGTWVQQLKRCNRSTTADTKHVANSMT
jgi:hypothetical protein